MVSFTTSITTTAGVYDEERLVETIHINPTQEYVTVTIPANLLSEYESHDHEGFGFNWNATSGLRFEYEPYPGKVSSRKVYYDISQLSSMNYGTVQCTYMYWIGWSLWNVRLTWDIYPPVYVTGIDISDSYLSLKVGETKQLTVLEVYPLNATETSVTWTSSNTDVATVGMYGFVTARSEGYATINCAANDGSGVKATCSVTVKNPVKPESITLPGTASVAEGETITLTPEITPADAETTLTWKSRNEAIATIDDNGVVTGVKEGNTFITVETDNGLSAYCKLTVTKPTPPEPTMIEIPEELTVGVGQKLKVDYTLTPKNAETTITWTIDDETVATIDGDGFLTGKTEGLAVITATTANGKTSNPCFITVTPAPEINVDVNGDGTVDVADISSIISVMAGQGGNITEKSADVNGDGTVDVADIAAVITRMAELTRLQRTMTEEE